MNKNQQFVTNSTIRRMNLLNYEQHRCPLFSNLLEAASCIFR